jgi:hypothetical protein
MTGSGLVLVERFETLTRKLVQIPKAKIDEKRKASEG